MNRKECLETALAIVSVDRTATHGNPEDNFQDIAALWSVYLGRQVTSSDVASMMILLKMARIKSNPKHEDHWIDVAGYAACGVEVTTSGR